MKKKRRTYLFVPAASSTLPSTSAASTAARSSLLLMVLSAPFFVVLHDGVADAVASKNGPVGQTNSWFFFLCFPVSEFSGKGKNDHVLFALFLRKSAIVGVGVKKYKIIRFPLFFHADASYGKVMVLFLTDEMNTEKVRRF